MQRESQPLCIKEANDGGYEQVPAMAFMKVMSSWQFPQSMPPEEPGKHTGSAFSCNPSIAVVGVYLLCYVMGVFLEY